MMNKGDFKMGLIFFGFVGMVFYAIIVAMIGKYSDRKLNKRIESLWGNHY